MEKRNTIQRQLVLQAVRQLHTQHPTAEQVYQQVIQLHPSISKATVYRNLSVLAKSGQLMQLPIPDQADRYDDTLAPHYHLCCTACGQVVDLPMTPLENLEKQAQEGSGCQVKDYTLVFRGLCGVCAKKAEA